MKIADYLLKLLKDNNCTDIFGIPGGVVLDLLYAADKTEGITPYLSYHEQAAAFEAIGYAQIEHTLGAAYATRGPGFTNLITGIADAYSESIPVLFITGHSGSAVGHTVRFEKEQELDTVSMVRYITKYADVVEDASEYWKIDKAIKTALSGRKGPVFLDFSSSVWNEEVLVDSMVDAEESALQTIDFSLIQELLEDSRRPIFLVGDGIRQSGTYQQVQELISKVKIPVLSSRGSQDVAGGNEYYYGYIGSHGIRYANMIFDKADLVIALGNRLAFPVNSETYEKSIRRKVFIQIEIEQCEIKTAIPELRSFCCDLSYALEKFITFKYRDYSGWIDICRQIKVALEATDVNKIIEEIGSEMNSITPQFTIVCDVGNNEFWASRAYEKVGLSNRIIYSKSFGALGCGIPKAIGAAIKTKNPVLVVVGDQGLQLNIQELQFVVQHRLPIEILVVDNKSSGMILDKEMSRYGYEVHTTKDSGYNSLDVKKLAEAYGFGTNKNCLPAILIINTDVYNILEPNIPRGRAMYDMSPDMDKELIENLKSL